MEKWDKEGQTGEGCMNHTFFLFRLWVGSAFWGYIIGRRSAPSGFAFFFLSRFCGFFVGLEKVDFRIWVNRLTSPSVYLWEMHVLSVCFLLYRACWWYVCWIGDSVKLSPNPINKGDSWRALIRLGLNVVVGNRVIGIGFEGNWLCFRIGSFRWKLCDQ